MDNGLMAVLTGAWAGGHSSGVLDLGSLCPCSSLVLWKCALLDSSALGLGDDRVSY